MADCAIELFLGVEQLLTDSLIDRECHPGTNVQVNFKPLVSAQVRF